MKQPTAASGPRAPHDMTCPALLLRARLGTEDPPGAACDGERRKPLRERCRHQAHMHTGWPGKLCSLAVVRLWRGEALSVREAEGSALPRPPPAARRTRTAEQAPRTAKRVRHTIPLLPCISHTGKNSPEMNLLPRAEGLCLPQLPHHAGSHDVTEHCRAQLPPCKNPKLCPLRGWKEAHTDSEALASGD